MKRRKKGRRKGNRPKNVPEDDALTGEIEALKHSFEELTHPNSLFV
jgi:hypothetical protein